MATVLDRQRLLKLKCPSCGSREKHEVNIRHKIDVEITDDLGNVIATKDEDETIGKIVTCNQCGHTTEYWACALAKAHYMSKANFWTIEEYDEWVRNEHHKNHDLVAYNPYGKPIQRKSL